MKNYNEEYERWLRNVPSDDPLYAELSAMENDEEKKESAFYQELAFGTAGLRGILGAGTNRMNIYTVGKASQGLANDILKTYPEEARRIVISMDSRINSELFSRVAASVFAANGIKTYLYEKLMPTPVLSYSVRRLHCCSGVMVTASHNPAKYNGYKVYGPDGCQMTDESADRVLCEINHIDVFRDICFGDFDELLSSGAIEYVKPEVLDDYLAEVKKQSVLLPDDPVNKELSMIYTPLNGTGLLPVTRLLSEQGFGNITVVEEQRNPDGHFPTCPYPNPELPEAMKLGLSYANDCDAAILLATDPDADRMAAAVRNTEGEMVLLSGNETGCLLLDYILAKRTQNRSLPEKPYCVKTIVTSDLVTDIAESYGVEVKDVLTGFKWIGDMILRHEKMGREHSYVFGFEESCGYLAGTYCRDKDSVVATMLFSEMAAYYDGIGTSVYRRLLELYRKYGYRRNVSYSFEFPGVSGTSEMAAIMEKLRNTDVRFGAYETVTKIDYLPGYADLPKSNVLKFVLSDGTSIMFRPSGTEPKLKCYLGTKGETAQAAKEKEDEIIGIVRPMIEK